MIFMIIRTTGGIIFVGNVSMDSIIFAEHCRCIGGHIKIEIRIRMEKITVCSRRQLLTTRRG
jgi:hypothetical protein